MRTGVGAGGATGDFGDESPRDPGLASPTPRALGGERPVVPGVPGASAHPRRATSLSLFAPWWRDGAGTSASPRALVSRRGEEPRGRFGRGCDGANGLARHRAESSATLALDSAAIPPSRRHRWMNSILNLSPPRHRAFAFSAARRLARYRRPLPPLVHRRAQQPRGGHVLGDELGVLHSCADRLADRPRRVCLGGKRRRATRLRVRRRRRRRASPRPPRPSQRRSACMRCIEASASCRTTAAPSRRSSRPLKRGLSSAADAGTATPTLPAHRATSAPARIATVGRVRSPPRRRPPPRSPRSFPQRLLQNLPASLRRGATPRTQRPRRRRREWFSENIRFAALSPLCIQAGRPPPRASVAARGEAIRTSGTSWARRSRRRRVADPATPRAQPREFLLAFHHRRRQRGRRRVARFPHADDGTGDADGVELVVLGSAEVLAGAAAASISAHRPAAGTRRWRGAPRTVDARVDHRGVSRGARG